MPTAPPSATDARVEAQVFWMRHGKEILAILAVAMLAAIGYAGYRFYVERQNSTAAVMLASAKNSSDFEQVIKQYPNTPAGASGYLLLAQAQRTEKNFAAANTTLQQFIGKYPTHELITSARMAMAANLEAMGKADDASAMYQQIASAYPKDFNAPVALIAQIRLLKAKNKMEDARRVCETILTQYRESFWANEALRELRGLKPTESEQAAARSTSPNGTNPPAMIARPPAAPASAVAPKAKKPK